VSYWLPYVICWGVAVALWLLWRLIRWFRAGWAATEVKLPEIERTWLEYAIENDDVIREVDAEREAARARMVAAVREAEEGLRWREHCEEQARLAEIGRRRREEQERQYNERAEREARERRERLTQASRIEDPVIRAATYRQLYTTAVEVLELEAARDDQGCSELIAVAQEQQRERALAELRGYRYVRNPNSAEEVRDRVAAAMLANGTRVVYDDTSGTISAPNHIFDWCYLCEAGDRKHVNHRDLSADIREVWAS
jgi:hypothetical protein